MSPHESNWAPLPRTDFAGLSEILASSCERAGGRSSELQVGVLGGSRDGSRVVLSVSPRGSRYPRWIAKIATRQSEGELLAREFDVLRSLHRRAPPHVTVQVPRAVAVHRDARLTMIVMTVMRGRRPLLPRLTQRGTITSRHILRIYIRRTLTWSEALARDVRSETPGALRPAELVERFTATLEAGSDARATAQAFGDAVRSADHSFTPHWQHGDLTVGNVLTDRRAVLVVDWAHASDAYEPWFDVAYTPGALALVAQAEQARTRVREAMLRVLSDGTWTGEALRQELERAWMHPIPLSWAVTLASMRAALREGQVGEYGWPAWREVTLTLLCDDEVRSTASWLAPRW